MWRELRKRRTTEKLGNFQHIQAGRQYAFPRKPAHSCGAQAHVSQDTKGNKMTESTQTNPPANPGGLPTSPTNPYEEGTPNTPAPPTNPYEEGGPAQPAVAPKADPDEE
jgi:hypothetical protein